MQSRNVRNLCSLEEFAVLVNSQRMKDFSLNGVRTIGKVVDVYDGDTARIVFFCEGRLVQYRIRMNGYDSPEMKPKKNIPKRTEAIALAKASKERLVDLVMNRIVYAEFGEFDKYGRPLAVIHRLDGCLNVMDNVNDLMINGGYGVPYSGGTKEPLDL